MVLFQDIKKSKLKWNINMKLFYGNIFLDDMNLNNKSMHLTKLNCSSKNQTLFHHRDMGEKKLIMYATDGYFFSYYDKSNCMLILESLLLSSLH